MHSLGLCLCAKEVIDDQRPDGLIRLRLIAVVDELLRGRARSLADCCGIDAP
jgi:hypothetical protein